MPHVDWRIKGLSMTTCNCAQGCPCQFNAPPTHGDCRAAVGMRIDEGHFGDVALDGVTWAMLLAWPGPIHEGDGEVLTIVDERATDEQRDAAVRITAGEETEPGATIYQVFAATFSKVHPPRFEPIEFDADLEGRRGRIAVDGLFEAQAGPIVNPISGAEHRVRVALPGGLEYTEAEYASGRAKAQGPIELDYETSHAHFAVLHMTAQGVVR